MKYALLLALLLPFAALAQDSEFTAQAAAAQREATALFPDLGKSGTQLNKRFVSEFRRLQSTADPLLSNPAWPKVLAKRCAEDLGIRPATGAPDEAAHSTASVQSSPLHLTPGGSRGTICGHVLQRVPEGMLVSCAEDADERRDIPGAPTSRFVIGATLTKGIVLLVGCPAEKTMADEDPIANVIGIEAGTFEYESTGGSMKTVRVFRYVNGR